MSRYTTLLIGYLKAFHHSVLKQPGLQSRYLPSFLHHFTYFKFPHIHTRTFPSLLPFPLTYLNTHTPHHLNPSYLIPSQSTILKITPSSRNDKALPPQPIPPRILLRHTTRWCNIPNSPQQSEGSWRAVPPQAQSSSALIVKIAPFSPRSANVLGVVLVGLGTAS